ncbi:hypothetical protein [Corallococcus sp. AB038B]|uniref:hypothetical protein n=1 Tax=Corallococcus sp. AB038B TaxID=2316718 RepID=UPI0013158A9F|nr:hypothetical protein [Corallococcus sp. AB038B]
MTPALRARLWRFVHNVVAHPLMEVLPEAWGDALHDWTARRAFIELGADARQGGAR